MKDTIKLFVIKTFKPTLYFVENDQFLGASVEKIHSYLLTSENTVRVQDLSTGEYNWKSLNSVFILESNAKKEAAKSIIPVDEGNLKLVKQLESLGVHLTAYQRQQILEDGEFAEVYQAHLPR